MITITKSKYTYKGKRYCEVNIHGSIFISGFEFKQLNKVIESLTMLSSHNNKYTKVTIDKGEINYE